MNEPAFWLSRTCVVVGVGEGLGAALGRRFAAGYKVALLARSAQVIENVAAQINAAASGTALPVRSDATVESQIAAAYERIDHELGPVEVLIYNGGRRPMGRLMETTPQVFEETWRLHAFGAFLWARQVVPDARAGARNDSDHGRHRGHPPVADFGGLRAGEIRGARTGAGDVARSSSARNPRGVCERRWRHRYAPAQEVAA